MSQFSNRQPQHEYEWSEPRPPIPGKESRQKLTEGMEYSGEGCSYKSTPSCFKWATSLSALLQDPAGVQLFKQYAESEGGIHADWLKFYFACEGLKQQVDPEKIKQIIGAIYKFLKKSQLVIPDNIRYAIKSAQHGEIVLQPDLFDQMQMDVEYSISSVTYRNFLQSDMYLRYVQNFSQPSQAASYAAQQAYLSASNSSSNSSEEQSKLVSRSSTLPTLHEDSECLNYGSGSDIEISNTGTIGRKSTMTMSLTREALMATERRRLEMRPAGVHNVSAYTGYSSYIPVSRRDSEIQSMSSGRTDSDTMSLSGMSNDGRPHYPRKHHYASMEMGMEKRMMKEIMNENAAMNEPAMIPRTKIVDAKKKMIVSPNDLFKELLPKLEQVKKEQEQNEKLAQKLQQADLTNKSLAEALRERLMVEDQPDQDILDQHVSRVFSDLTPVLQSPGNATPGPSQQHSQQQQQQQGRKRQPIDVNMFVPCSSTQSSMRHSKSVPDGQRKLCNKWPSMNTDSGISLLSTDTWSKYKDTPSAMHKSLNTFSNYSEMSLAPSASSAMTLDDTKRKIEEENKKLANKRYLPPPPAPPAQNVTILPPAIPAKPQQSLIQDSSSYTIAVYSFCDEDVPYRIKLPGSAPPTLKQFKDNLPKKGNYRFFFKTRCDDVDSGVIQEEINNDNEVLPLFEGKVMGTVKSADQ
ncbi:axin [Culicoides brevitarsis]|uniref:axin n=1 Tax=Culicoides brevitarsis TaxID=469753 RepID=UPI00307CBD33